MHRRMTCLWRLLLTKSIAYFLLIHATFAAFLSAQQLHHRLSKRELKQLFGVDRHAEVPEYEIVHLRKSEEFHETVTRRKFMQPDPEAKSSNFSRRGSYVKAIREPSLHVQFRAWNQDFRLRLNRNTKLLSERLISVIRDGNSSRLFPGTLPKKSECHYVGHVLSHEATPAALSGCTHMRGVLSAGDHLFVIQPLPKRFRRSAGELSGLSGNHTATAESHFAHVIYRRSASLNPNSDSDSLDEPQSQRFPGDGTDAVPEEEFCDARFENVTFPQGLTRRQRSVRGSHHLSLQPVLSLAYAGFDEGHRPAATFEVHNISVQHFLRHLDYLLNYSVPFLADTDDVPTYNGSAFVTVELAVFLDVKLWEHFQREFGDSRAEQELIDFSLAVINNVYVLYQQPSMKPKIDVVIVRHEIWKVQPDDLAAAKHKSGQAQMILDLFCSHQAQFNPGTDTTDPTHWDHGTLLTGFDIYHITTSVAGVAPVARMCDKPYSCSVVEGMHLGRSFVLAHEIGHNLGMVHDGVQNKCSNKCCLMSPVNGAGKTTWSTCSVNELNIYLNGLGTYGQPENCLIEQLTTISREHKLGRLPGQRYTADQQCGFFWGRDYRNEVPSGGSLSEICNIIWCGNGGSSISTSHPALEGTYCGERQWCSSGQCAPWPEYNKTLPAAVNGGWAEWRTPSDASCSQCSITNGLRVRRQMRVCDNPAPNNGGQVCPGSDFRGAVCNAESNCAASTKQAYGDSICASFAEKSDTQLTGKSFEHPDSPCKIWCHLAGSDLIRNKALFPDGSPCGDSRFCVNGRCMERACAEKAWLVAANPGDCADYPVWLEWTAWSACSTSCRGINGTKIRTRNCSLDALEEPHRSVAKQAYGNGLCSVSGGAASETESCSAASDCPALWSVWSQWSACSQTCGPALQSRNRSCNSNLICEGAAIDYQPCNVGSCSLWSQWSPWSECSQTCGTEATQSRNRTCPTSAQCIGTTVESRQCPNLLPCAGGGWNDWEGWSRCTPSCGANSRRIRFRTCKLGFPPETCPGSSKNEAFCKFIPCEQLFSSWSDWGDCSVSCGGGLRERQRRCLQGVGACDGATRQSEECNTQACHVWSSWGEWSECGQTCGIGKRSRERACRGTNARLRFISLAYREDFSVDAKGCVGLSKITEDCSVNACPAASAAPAGPSPNAWQPWSSCSRSCNNGLRKRLRTCNAADCIGPLFEVEDCRLGDCSDAPISSAPLILAAASPLPILTTSAYPVRVATPEWSAWSAWSDCSCFTLMRIRRRQCLIRQPELLGFCMTAPLEQEDCTPTDCKPVTGQWSQWSEWSQCSQNCGNEAERVRFRICSEPFPINRGTYCLGKPFDNELCGNLSACSSTEAAVAGGWSAWASWSECPLSSCGRGDTRTRTRFCNNPLPRNGGAQCVGADYSIVPCPVRQNCPEAVDGKFEKWSKWQDCNASCGFAFKTRFRQCNNPQTRFGGKKCRGLAYNTQVCALPSCSGATDGNWGEWGEWSACSVNCGYGQQTRQRECNSPVASNGGLPCLGALSESQSCTNGDLSCRNLLTNQDRVEQFTRDWEMFVENERPRSEEDDGSVTPSSTTPETLVD